MLLIVTKCRGRIGLKSLWRKKKIIYKKTHRVLRKKDYRQRKEIYEESKGWRWWRRWPHATKGWWPRSVAHSLPYPSIYIHSFIHSPMLFTHATYMLHICFIYASYMLHICFILAPLMLHPCSTHAPPTGKHHLTGRFTSLIIHHGSDSLTYTYLYCNY